MRPGRSVTSPGFDTAMAFLEESREAAEAEEREKETRGSASWSRHRHWPRRSACAPRSNAKAPVGCASF